MISGKERIKNEFINNQIDSPNSSRSTIITKIHPDVIDVYTFLFNKHILNEAKIRYKLSKHPYNLTKLRLLLEWTAKQTAMRSTQIQTTSRNRNNTQIYCLKLHDPPKESSNAQLSNNWFTSKIDALRCSFPVYFPSYRPDFLIKYNKKITQRYIRNKYANRTIVKDTKDAFRRGRASLASRIQPRHTEDAKRLSYGRFALRNRHSFQKLVHAQWTYGCIIYTFAILRPLRGHSVRILMWTLWMLSHVNCWLVHVRATNRALNYLHVIVFFFHTNFVHFWKFIFLILNIVLYYTISG